MKVIIKDCMEDHCQLLLPPQAQWSLQCRDKYRLLSSSEETLEDWCGDEDGMCAQTKSQALPKSPSIHEQLWVGIQRKSHDLLVRGTNTLLNRSLNKDDAAQVPTGGFIFYFVETVSLCEIV